MPTTGAASCCASRPPVSTPSASRPVAPRWRPVEAGVAAQAGKGRGRRRCGPAAATSAPSGKTREGTKQAMLVGMLDRAEGATIDEIVAATGWQPHTVRGAFAGALRKRLGLTVASEKVEGRGRVYRIDGRAQRSSRSSPGGCDAARHLVESGSNGTITLIGRSARRAGGSSPAHPAERAVADHGLGDARGGGCDHHRVGAVVLGFPPDFPTWGGGCSTGRTS